MATAWSQTRRSPTSGGEVGLGEGAGGAGPRIRLSCGPSRGSSGGNAWRPPARPRHRCSGRGVRCSWTSARTLVEDRRRGGAVPRGVYAAPPSTLKTGLPRADAVVSRRPGPARPAEGGRDRGRVRAIPRPAHAGCRCGIGRAGPWRHIRPAAPSSLPVRRGAVPGPDGGCRDGDGSVAAGTAEAASLPTAQDSR